MSFYKIRIVSLTLISTTSIFSKHLALNSLPDAKMHAEKSLAKTFKSLVRRLYTVLRKRLCCKTIVDTKFLQFKVATGWKAFIEFSEFA